MDTKQQSQKQKETIKRLWEEYDFLDDLSHGTHNLLRFSFGGKLGLYDLKTNRVVLPAEYDGIYSEFGLLWLYKSDITGLFDILQQAMIAVEKVEVDDGHLNKEFYTIKIGKNYGVYDASRLSLVLPVEYQDFFYHNRESLWVKVGETWSLYDIDRQVTLNLGFRSIHNLSFANLYGFRSDLHGKFGIYDVQAKSVVLPAEYDQIFTGGVSSLICLKRGGEFRYYDSFSQTVIQIPEGVSVECSLSFGLYGVRADRRVGLLDTASGEIEWKA